MSNPKYDPCLHIVLHQPEIPYNTGSIGRTCVAVGAKLWLVRPLGFRMDDYYLRRAGLDYWEHLDFEILDDWQGVETHLLSLTSRPPWLFSKSAKKLFTSASFDRGEVLVFGNESQGLPASLMERYSASTLRIPIRSQVRSLNLSNSVAIAAYEAVRQGLGGLA